MVRRETSPVRRLVITALHSLIVAEVSGQEWIFLAGHCRRPQAANNHRHNNRRSHDFPHISSHLVPLQEGDDVLDAPDVIRKASLHRRCHAERLMDASEIMSSPGALGFLGRLRLA